MRLTLSLPFDVVLLSRDTYTQQEAEEIIADMPVGFEIIDDDLVNELTNPIYFPIVEDNNAGSSKEKRS